MTENDLRTRKLDEPTTGTYVRRFDGAMWWQVCVNVAYVLIAAPLGLGYLLAFAVGLVLDLPHLGLRLVGATILGLLRATIQSSLWLLRFGPRFLWVCLIVGVIWTFQAFRWLVVSTGRAVARTVGSVVVDILHPRTAWHRAVASLRGDREPIGPRFSPSVARVRSMAIPMWPDAGRVVDAYYARLRRLGRQVVPRRALVVRAVWWRLARWERYHTMRWLSVDLPVLGPPGYSPSGPADLLSPLPFASLGFLLLKFPLGVLGSAIAGIAVGISTEQVRSGNTGTAVALGLACIAALHMLGNFSGSFAKRAFSPSATVRRLHLAEAQAAHERDRASRADQSRRDLIINLGHELRTPTANIMGHVESMLLALDGREASVPPEMLRTYLSIVQRESERLGSLVDDLLAVARAERAELHLTIARVDAAEVIHEVYQALAPLARRERQVVLVHEVQPGLPPLLADRQRLSQVLLNLVRNAITYTPEGGLVSISLRRADRDRLLLSVADTGSGITPDDLERVFERFYRADASRTRASGGFGLGLAIARDLVEAMGGTITAESVVGEGSCFHVMLPVAADHL